MAACLGGGWGKAQDNLCHPRYSGERCAKCSIRHYRLEGLCEPCPSVWWLIPSLLLVFVLCCWCFIRWVQRNHVNIAAVTIGIDYLQALSMFGSFKLRWPAEVKALFSLMSAVCVAEKPSDGRVRDEFVPPGRAHPSPLPSSIATTAGLSMWSSSPQNVPLASGGTKLGGS